MNRCILVFAIFVHATGIHGDDSVLHNQCFCQLKGRIDDCNCTVDTVDHFNNVKIYPVLQSLLIKDYFRFYKVNLKKTCPFWADDSKCAMRYCHVQPCLDEHIPPGLKGHLANQKPNTAHAAYKYLENTQSDCDDELSYINTTISASTYEDFKRWQEYDNKQDNFCMYDDEDDEEYVDLLLNPERYTGYKGQSAHRIWNSIYKENCFRPKDIYTPYIQSSHLNGMCLEQRAFYRAISGLHTSINIHLCAKYLLSDRVSLGIDEPGGKWGPNLSEFKFRFSPETTNGEGPNWLKNLYFLYLLELKAIYKAAPYLHDELYYTGNEEEDLEVQEAMKDFLKIVQQFPEHFDEYVMFSAGKQAERLKAEFREHFRNISRIMDCVGCDKCKLWGKLQIKGLGTALKILFSGKFDKRNTPYGAKYYNNVRFQLERGEIVSLINAFGRLSTSIYELGHFRSMMSRHAGKDFA
ncbi:ero1-like protein [Schistocerca gregaria]|uniref:ero1-like protein n=1 Tax=Schistocerca gregaria TaxID=7010 RepID=UPI00211E7321|nr:ero1-like protein [Schistocerca gregaria]